MFTQSGTFKVSKHLHKRNPIPYNDTGSFSAVCMQVSSYSPTMLVPAHRTSLNLLKFRGRMFGLSSVRTMFVLIYTEESPDFKIPDPCYSIYPPTCGLA